MTRAVIFRLKCSVFPIYFLDCYSLPTYYEQLGFWTYQNKVMKPILNTGNALVGRSLQSNSLVCRWEDINFTESPNKFVYCLRKYLEFFSEKWIDSKVVKESNWRRQCNRWERLILEKEPTGKTKVLKIEQCWVHSQVDDFVMLQNQRSCARIQPGLDVGLAPRTNINMT